MKITSTTVITVLASLLLSGGSSASHFTDVSDLATITDTHGQRVSALTKYTHRIRQTTREKVAAHELARAHGFVKRQAAPSAVIGPCGIVDGARFLVRVTGTQASAMYTAASPGYAFGSPNVVFDAGDEQARISPQLTDASIFTLNAAAGCSLTRLSGNGGSISSVPSSATNGGSVTVIGPAAGDARFAPYLCRADVQGVLTCTLAGSTLVAFPYSANGNTRVAFIGTCYAGTTACANRAGVTFTIVPV